MRNEERPTINCDCGDMLMDPAAIEKGTVLRLIQHLKPDRSSCRDDIHPSITKVLSDVIAEPMVIQFDISLRHFRLPRYWKETIISPVYKA